MFMHDFIYLYVHPTWFVELFAKLFVEIFLPFLREFVYIFFTPFLHFSNYHFSLYVLLCKYIVICMCVYCIYVCILNKE